ncbi:MBG domain-containing protein [Flavobacterium psychrotolerans]|uniref:G8 domain-containing protein n=1 Tax=Flavobacterium psychrotolerans TaxID=2169410 RepID=A0A2U1JJW9_9FLAO|nr:MBG domain-containing protein [Flavobacterium psychrotolerans]PWA05441.1 hypothetical protein DB895_07555 [Flavobacterium psychrotolerans]
MKTILTQKRLNIRFVFFNLNAFLADQIRLKVFNILERHSILLKPIKESSGGNSNKSKFIVHYSKTTAIFAFIGLLSINMGYSQITKTAKSGFWGTASTWSPSGVPASGDIVVIPNGVTLTGDISTTCSSMTFNGAAATLTVNAGNTVMVTGAVTLNNAANSASAAALSGLGTLSCGSFFVGGSSIITGSGTVTLTSSISNLNISGNLTLTGQDIGGGKKSTPNFSLSTGTVSVGGIIKSVGQKNSASTFTMATGLNNGTLNLGGTTFFDLANVDNSGTITFSVTLTTVNFNGSANAQTIPFVYPSSKDKVLGLSTSPLLYKNLNVNNTNAGGATLGAAVTATNVTGSIAVGNVNTGSLLNTNNNAITLGNSDRLTVGVNSTMNAGTSVISFGTSGTVTIDGLFQTANTAGFSGSSTTAIKNTNNPTITLGGSSIIEYNSVGNQLVTNGKTYNDLTLSGSGTKTFAGVMTISSTLSIGGSAIASLVAGTTSTANSLTLGGVNKIGGSWGSSSSGATNKNNTFFAATTGVVNVASDSRLTAVFSNLTASQTVIYGVASIALSGTVGAGIVHPADAEIVSITINGVSKNATILGGAGGFTLNFPTATIPYSSGGYTITYSYVGNVDLIAVSDSATTLMVNKKGLSIIANGQAKIYGVSFTFSGSEFTTSGLINSDTLSSITLTSGGTLTTATVGYYAIVPSAATGTGLSNYTITYTNATLTVNAKALTITANNANKIYGTLFTFSGSEFVASGLENSDVVSTVTLTSAGASVVSAVNLYAIIPIAAIGTGLSNYTITYASGTLTVNAKALTITANNQAKCAGTNFSFAGTEFTFGILMNGDSISGVSLSSIGAAPSALSGSYDIVISNATGTGLTNYNITYVKGFLLVNQTPTVATNGSTQTICALGTATLVGNIPAVGIGAWSVASGPSTLSSQFSNTTLAGSIFTPIGGAGDYVVRWSISNGSCLVSYADATITVGSITIWNGTAWSKDIPTSTSAAVISGNYNSLTNGGSIMACTLTINSNAIVVISSGYKVTLNGALSVDNGSSITFENNSGLIQGGTTNTNSGNIIIKRNSSSLYLLDYTLWSSPVEGQNLYNFSPNTVANRFYYYDSTTDFYTPISVANNFNVGQGYLIRVPRTFSATVPAIFNGVFTGKPNSGNINYAMNLGYNAVGNPYPSQINFSEFVAANETITGTLYFWRKTNSPNASSYATLTTLGFTANGAAGGDTGSSYYDTETCPVGNWVINVGQGFIVKATSASNLVFNNAMRRELDNGNQFFRNSQVSLSDVSLYWLNLTNASGIFNQMAVGYTADATLGVDRGIDGLNINSANYLCSIIESAPYAIQGRPEYSADDIVPLEFNITTAGEYSIGIDHLNGLFQNQDVFLKDKLVNTIYDLKVGSYTFATEAGKFNSRFEIVYKNTLAANQSTFNENNVVAYKQNQEIIINTGHMTMTNVKVYDIRGRLLKEKYNLNAAQAKFYTGNTNEILIVKITLDNLETITKKVVN